MVVPAEPSRSLAALSTGSDERELLAGSADAPPNAICRAALDTTLSSHLLLSTVSPRHGDATVGESLDFEQVGLQGDGWSVS